MHRRGGRLRVLRMYGQESHAQRRHPRRCALHGIADVEKLRVHEDPHAFRRELAGEFDAARKQQFQPDLGDRAGSASRCQNACASPAPGISSATTSLRSASVSMDGIVRLPSLSRIDNGSHNTPEYRPGERLSCLGPCLDLLPGRGLHARAAIHPREPRGEIGRCLRQRRPFRCRGQEIHLRRDLDAGQRPRLAGKVVLPAQKAAKLFEYGMPGRHGCFNRSLVRGPAHEKRLQETLEYNNVSDALEEIPVGNVHDLIHPGGGLWIGGREGRLRQDAVQIAEDGLGFLQHEIAVLQHGHFAERLPRNMRLALVETQRYRRDAVGSAFLLKRNEDRARERAAWNGMYDELWHDCPPLVLCPGIICKFGEESRPAFPDLLVRIGAGTLQVSMFERHKRSARLSFCFRRLQIPGRAPNLIGKERSFIDRVPRIWILPAWEKSSMHPSHLQYLPLPWPLYALLFAVLGILSIFIQIGIIRYVYARLGISPATAMVLLLASLLGSYVNIPIAHFPGETVVVGERVDFFGMEYILPAEIDWPGTIIAINLGGAVIPILLSLYLLTTRRIWGPGIVATAAVSVVCFMLAMPVQGAGITIPVFIPPLAACAISCLLAWSQAPAVAYVSGSLGTLIGADLMNFGAIQKLGTPVASIGGAGTFDGIFVTGIFAVVLASIVGALSPGNAAPGTA